MIDRFGKGDEYFMAQALAQARRAAEQKEVPIGAVVVNPDGIIVGRGYNKVEQLHSQLAHAELRAVQQACKKQQDWRLNGHWVYVTLEPCAMCMHALRMARVEGVVYGADSPLFGYRLDNNDDTAVYKKTIVIKGVSAHESAALLKNFFQQKRKKSE